MVAIARSDIAVHIQQVLLVTEKHFGIDALPGSAHVLDQGECVDPLRLCWLKRQRRASGINRLASTRP